MSTERAILEADLQDRAGILGDAIITLIKQERSPSVAILALLCALAEALATIKPLSGDANDGVDHAIAFLKEHRAQIVKRYREALQ